MTKRKSRKAGIGSAFDDFLKEEGTFGANRTVAIKRVLAWQIEQAMKENHITRRRWPAGWPPAAASSAPGSLSGTDRVDDVDLRVGSRQSGDESHEARHLVRGSDDGVR